MQWDGSSAKGRSQSRRMGLERRVGSSGEGWMGYGRLVQLQGDGAAARGRLRCGGMYLRQMDVTQSDTLCVSTPPCRRRGADPLFPGTAGKRAHRLPSPPPSAEPNLCLSFPARPKGRGCSSPFPARLHPSIHPSSITAGTRAPTSSRSSQEGQSNAGLPRSAPPGYL